MPLIVARLTKQYIYLCLPKHKTHHKAKVLILENVSIVLTPHILSKRFFRRIDCLLR